MAVGSSWRNDRFLRSHQRGVAQPKTWAAYLGFTAKEYPYDSLGADGEIDAHCAISRAQRSRRRRLARGCAVTSALRGGIPEDRAIPNVLKRQLLGGHLDSILFT